MRQGMRWTMFVAVGFLALVGVGASAAHYLQAPYNPGFLEFPVATALHVILGGVYLTLAPFQFAERIRSRHLVYHRWAGRVLVAIGLMVGAAGVFMAVVIPAAGWSERVVVGSFGLLFLLALGKGFLHVRAGRVAMHREWMIRAFAIALAIATTRLISIPALLIVGVRTDGQVATLVIVSFTVAFVVHALLAEAWIRATRRRSAFPGQVLREPREGRGAPSGAALRHRTSRQRAARARYLSMKKAAEAGQNQGGVRS